VNRKSPSNPLTERYASSEMAYVFSPDFKFVTWRRLWIALAEAEKELGLDISQAQIDDMKAHAENVNYEEAEKREREVRHDVMAHVHAFGLQATSAKGIIHLGATSAYVGDNTDLIQIREGLGIVRRRIVTLISKLRELALRWKDTPTLAFTHFQPAQLTTVGKRATLWLHDLLIDLEEIDFRLATIKFLGAKGATGTQASFLKLFDGDANKVRRLDELVARKAGFDKVYAVSGQTYSRKVDAQALSSLGAFAQSASKFAFDMRLLQHMHEIEEPFEEHQIGSSAMAYKRNPMRAERIDSLARHLIINTQNPAHTAATQWFERTLDDSANRRISIPEAFLAADSLAMIYDNIVSGIHVHQEVIAANVARELPFIATENFMMEGVRRGGDRQELHERVRVHAKAAADRLKSGAGNNDLLERIARDEAFRMSEAELTNLARAEEFVGLSPQQVVWFVESEVDPVLARHRALVSTEVGEVRV